MNWDWQQFLAGAAFIAALAALWDLSKVREQLHLADLTPTKKWRKAIRSPRHVPKHKPDQVPAGATESDLRFFRDFQGVADYLNSVYNDQPWSFENTGRLECRGMEQNSEREIEVRYNSQKTGRIRLNCIAYGKSGRVGDVILDFELINARFFGGYEVIGLARTLAEIVADMPAELATINSAIEAAMIDSMWQVGELATGNPELAVTFRGNAKWFLEWSARRSNSA